MTRHTENLARLHSKLLARYGANDPMVRDLKRELESMVGVSAAAPMLTRACSAAPVQGHVRFRPHRRFGAVADLSAR